VSSLIEKNMALLDGVVKSPVSFVAGFSQNLNIPYVLLRA